MFWPQVVAFFAERCHLLTCRAARLALPHSSHPCWILEHAHTQRCTFVWHSQRRLCSCSCIVSAKARGCSNHDVDRKAQRMAVATMLDMATRSRQCVQELRRSPELCQRLFWTCLPNAGDYPMQVRFLQLDGLCWGKICLHCLHCGTACCDHKACC